MQTKTAAWAQGSQNPGTVIWENDPAAIPNAGAADLIAENFWLEELTITNTTAGALTITILDKQTSPKSFMTAKSIAANDFFTFSSKGRYFPGGLNWVASGAGLVGAVRGRVRGR